MTLKDSPGDTRPIWDIDGNDARLVDAIAKTWSGARSRAFQDPDDRDRRLGVLALHRGERSIFLEFTPGRAGVKSSIVKAGGTELSREVEDAEFTPLRYLMYAPSGGHFVILLAEEVGRHGAVTMFRNLLEQSFDKYLPAFRLRVVPAITEDVIRRATAEQPVKALVFKRPPPTDPQGKLIEIAGESVALEFRMTPRRRRFWTSRQLPNDPNSQLPTTERVLGF